MSGHSADYIGEDELVGQIEAPVEGEELKDIRMRAVGWDGHRAAPADAAQPAFAMSESGHRAGIGERVLRDAVQRRVDTDGKDVDGSGSERDVRVLHDQHEFHGSGRRRCPGEAGRDVRTEDPASVPFRDGGPVVEGADVAMPSAGDIRFLL